ncbi:MFS transporter asaE [Colletotrichum viniferum]|nr:MFS transporter asaE [Colletotrichum viniferum]
MFEENYPGSPSPEAAVQEMIATEEPEKYPEGGKDAWLVVAGAWCAMIPSMGLLNTLAVLQAWVTEYELQGLPESTIGWVFSTYAFFLYFCGAQVGPIFDAHDVRYLVIPGCIGIVAAIMLMSFCKEFYQFFLTFGVLGGMSASLLFNPSISAIGHWFSERRALATGIACTAGGVGGVIFPLSILYLAPRVGFAWALRTFALTTLAVFLIEFAVFIPYTYICSYAIHEGMGLQKSLLLNALLNAGAIPGRALPGYVADRFGPFNVMCVTALVCSIFIFALWMTAQGGEAATTAFAILFGFWSGAAISLTPVCIGRVCETKDYGKRSGTAFSISSIAALVVVPFAGAILQWCDGAYYGVIVFAGGLYVLALVAFIIARGVAGGWAFTVLY